MLLLKEDKNNTKDLSETVLRNNLLDEYIGENTHDKVMPSHRIFKEAVQADIEFQQKEDRLRRIHETVSGASVEHIEPYTFVSEKDIPYIKEARTEPISRKSEAIYYVRFRRIMDVFNEIIGLMGRVADVNISILENTLNIRYSDDVSTSTTVFNVNKNDEERIRNILESVVLILDKATDTKIFSDILNKIK